MTTFGLVFVENETSPDALKRSRNSRNRAKRGGLRDGRARVASRSSRLSATERAPAEFVRWRRRRSFRESDILDKLSGNGMTNRSKLNTSTPSQRRRGPLRASTYMATVSHPMAIADPVSNLASISSAAPTDALHRPPQARASNQPRIGSPTTQPVSDCDEPNRSYSADEHEENNRPSMTHNAFINNTLRL